MAVGGVCLVACPADGSRNTIVNNTIAGKQAFTIWNGDGEIVVNNILVGDGRVFWFEDDTQDVVIDYNLSCWVTEESGTYPEWPIISSGIDEWLEILQCCI